MEEINAVRSLFNGASVPEIILTVGVSLLFLAYGIYRGINYYRESVRRQERLRELFPDVSRGVRHFDFTYKGFEACLDWKNREEEYFSSDDEIGHSTMPHTYFKVFMPDKLQKKIRALHSGKKYGRDRLHWLSRYNRLYNPRPYGRPCCNRPYC